MGWMVPEFISQSGQSRLKQTNFQTTSSTLASNNPILQLMSSYVCNAILIVVTYPCDNCSRIIYSDTVITSASCNGLAFQDSVAITANVQYALHQSEDGIPQAWMLDITLKYMSEGKIETKEFELEEERWRTLQKY